MNPANFFIPLTVPAHLVNLERKKNIKSLSCFIFQLSSVFQHCELYLNKLALIYICNLLEIESFQDFSMDSSWNLWKICACVCVCAVCLCMHMNSYMYAYVHGLCFKSAVRRTSPHWPFYYCLHIWCRAAVKASASAAAPAISSKWNSHK